MGAGCALAGSFAVLALAWRTSRLDGERTGWALPSWLAVVIDSPWLRTVLRCIGLVVGAVAAWAAVFGRDASANPALGVFYIYLWVGLVPLSLLVGNVWPLLSPVRTLHLGLSRLLATPPDRGLVAYPSWLGCWPAAIGLFAFVWTELVDPDAAFVSTVVTWCLWYGATMLVGAAVFGDRFLAQADPFEVWFGFVARLSPWSRREDADGRRQVVLRNPLDNLDGLRPQAGLLAVVAVLLGSTAYDSFSNSNWWLQQTAVPGALDPTLRDTVVLVGFVAFVAVTFVAAALAAPGMSWADRRTLPRRLAHSLVPIGVGYIFAHYLTLLVETGQAYLIFLSDPLVTGEADYLGTADWTVNYFLSTRPELVAGAKVAFVLTGHILGVIAAHDRAIRLLPMRHVVSGQLAMLAAMLGYTVGGLLLLFSV